MEAATHQPPAADRLDRTSLVLETVRRSAVGLLNAIGTPPRRLHVRAGDVAIDLEWPEAPAGTALAGPSPQAGPETSMAEPVTEVEATHLIRAEVVGTFYRASSPGAKPFIREGDFVQPGQQVAIIEAMKLMIPVTAHRHGKVTEVRQPDASSVEYDQPLFVVAPIDVD